MLFSILFNDFIETIERPTIDGYNAKTAKPLYVKIPCRFFDEVMLAFNEVLVKENYTGTFFIPTQCTLELEDIITYKNREYIIKNIQTKKPLIGPAQYIQLRVIDNGGN